MNNSRVLQHLYLLYSNPQFSISQDVPIVEHEPVFEKYASDYNSARIHEVQLVYSASFFSF